MATVLPIENLPLTRVSIRVRNRPLQGRHGLRAIQKRRASTSSLSHARRIEHAPGMSALIRSLPNSESLKPTRRAPVADIVQSCSRPLNLYVAAKLGSRARGRWISAGPLLWSSPTQETTKPAVCSASASSFPKAVARCASFFASAISSAAIFDHALSNCFSASSMNLPSAGLVPGPPAKWPQIEGTSNNFAFNMLASSNCFS